MHIIIDLDNRDKDGDPTVTVTPSEERRNVQDTRYIYVEIIENGVTKILGKVTMTPVYERSRDKP